MICGKMEENYSTQKEQLDNAFMILFLRRILCTCMDEKEGMKRKNKYGNSNNKRKRRQSGELVSSELVIFLAANVSQHRVG